MHAGTTMFVGTTMFADITISVGITMDVATIESTGRTAGDTVAGCVRHLSVVRCFATA